MQGKKIEVGSDGYVMLVDVMGDDQRIVDAARVSYGEGTKKVSTNLGLIRYLMRHRHTSPFEQCELQFLVRVPMDIWRQWIRHRTASVNEYSTRYSVAIDSMAKTEPRDWRLQSKSNKQGSEGLLDTAEGTSLTIHEEEFQEKAREVYKYRLERGVAREQARKDLPLSTYTEAYWKIDLHNLLHFLSLRMDSHAQKEIRDYANVLAEIVKQLFPLTWDAFKDYRLDSVSLTGLDVKAIQRIMLGEDQDAVLADIFSNKREEQECTAKLRRLGISEARLP